MKNIFDILKTITYDKSDLDFNNHEIDKLYDIYMINRWLSMCEAYIPILDGCNSGKFSKSQHYNYLKVMIPKSRFFEKYTKKDVELSNKYDLISKFYNVSNAVAIEYYKNLNDEDILKISNYLDKLNEKV